MILYFSDQKKNPVGSRNEACPRTSTRINGSTGKKLDHFIKESNNVLLQERTFFFWMNKKEFIHQEKYTDQLLTLNLFSIQ